MLTRTIIFSLTLIGVLSCYLFWINNNKDRDDIKREKHEVVILNSSISASEIRSIYNNTLKIKSSTNDINWFEVGPKDVGGRVRALVIDRTNSNTIITGGATGGIWKSTDNGNTWALKSSTLFNFSITSIVQHPTRNMHWYASTGEVRSSANANNSRIYGSGTLYTSSDNGETWSEVSAPQKTNNYLYLTSRLVISPTTGTFFVATNGFGIARSTDNSVTFTNVLGDPNGSYNFNIHSDNFVDADIAVNSNGHLLAHISGELEAGAGFYKSTDDGLTWQNITPNHFSPKSYLDMNRGVLAFSESNPNVAYSFSEGGSDTPSKSPELFFHKIDFLTGMFENRTQNLPKLLYSGNPLVLPAPQAGWNMALAVKPDDENFVVIGGASGGPFRTTNGYETDHGSYSDWYDLKSSTNYISNSSIHNDQHILVFDPEQPNVLWAGNDGGVFKIEDLKGNNNTNSWIFKSNGLNITQFYDVSIAPQSSGNQVVGGSQDNGHRTIKWDENSSQSTNKRPVCGGDGIKSYWGENYLLLTGIGGKSPGIVDQNKLMVGPIGEVIFAKHKGFLPKGNSGSNSQSFAVNPNNENVVFLTRGGPELYRTTNAKSWVNTSSIDRVKNSIETFSLADIGIENTRNINFQALSFSKNPDDILYFSTSTNGWDNDQTPPQLFKLANASAASLSEAIEITPDLFPQQGQIIDIALNPQDADEVIVVLSDNDKVSLFHSTNGGADFEIIEGNLNSGNYSPAFRDAEIVVTNNSDKTYFLATTMGLYSTENMNGSNTEWRMEAPDIIGASFVSSLDFRESDQMLAVGTHGRGIFMGQLSSQILSVDDGVIEKNNISIYPNPSHGKFHISINNPLYNESCRVEIYDLKSSLVLQKHFIDQIELTNYVFDISQQPKGFYFIKISINNSIITRKVVVM